MVHVIKPMMTHGAVDFKTEHNEVILDKGDGMLDVGMLTRCKNAVCYIYCSKEETEKRGSGFFAVINLNSVEFKVIVTNNHVLSSKEEASTAVARFHYEGKLPGADVRLKPEVLFFTHDVLDYTIVGCDSDTIENMFCIDPIDFVEEEPMSVGDDIFIFQHPKGEIKKFSYQKISKIERPYVYYNADTDIGSSGSVVLRKLKLIAVHSKGSDLLQYNKGTLCSEILNHLKTGSYTRPTTFSIESDCQNKRKSESIDGQQTVVKKIREDPVDNNDSKTPSPVQLDELSKEIVSYWKPLARKLLIPNFQIENISKDHINYGDLNEKAYAILNIWLEQSGSTASIKTLRDALFSLGKKSTGLKHFPQ